MGEYLHMLAQALLGVETDRNRCTGLYRLYSLHPADVELRLEVVVRARGPNVTGSRTRTWLA
jgi:hypothetical protein